MPKRAKELTAVQVKRLRARGLYSVGVVAGLALHVTDTGARSWILRARVGSKRRDIGLGAFPDVTLAQARDKARAARDKIRDGVDVVAEREAARRALIAAQRKRMTFADAARAKHTVMAAGFRSAKHARQWLSVLQRYAFPILGSMDVADVGVADVVAVLRPIWNTKTPTAKRARQRIESVLDWATVAGHRTGDNPARWGGNLEELLAAPGRLHTATHHAAMPWQEMPAFMAKLRKRKGTGARALELAILTAARSGEVRGMVWDEVDTATGTWTIPAARMKAGRKHVVSLSADALALVKAQPHHLGSRYVFAAVRGGMLSDMSLSAVCRRMKVAAVPHGFRSSFKDWARNRTAYADEVSELALAHVNDNATRAAYARDGLLPQRARLLAEWAKYCAEGMPDNASVTPIRRAHA